MVKDTQNISKTANCSLKLIRQSANEGWVRQLALFHFCKSIYGNSAIYNYRHRMPELSQKFIISTKTLYNYFHLLRRKELVFDFGNHLSLKSIREIKHQLNDKIKCNINIQDTDSINHITCRLLAKILEAHIKKMAFAKAIKEFGRQDLNKLRSGEVASPPLFSLSIRTAAKLLNINERTMIKVLKTLQVLKIIKIYPQKPVKISHEKMDISFVSDYPGYRFITDKGTYQQFGQRIELIQYPVLIPKMTYKQYLKFYKSD